MIPQTNPSQQSEPITPDATPRFISMRWRFITPMFVAVLVVAMLGAFFVARNISGGLQVSQTNILLQSTRAVGDRAAQLSDYHRQEAQRVAFTIGVPDAVRANQPETLDPILRSLARVNNLDSMVLTDSVGNEILGMLRVDPTSGAGFALSTATDLSQQPIVQSVLDDGNTSATSLMVTAEGLLLYTAAPVYASETVIGVALVGQKIDSLLEDLKSSAVADLVLYGPDGALLATTFPTPEQRQSLNLDPEVFNQALLAENAIPQLEFTVDGAKYQGTAQPFRFGSDTLGVVGTLMQDNIPFITEAGRQLTALLTSILAGVVVIVAFAGMEHFARRAEQVTIVADELTAGQSQARTGMLPTDEIGSAGHALDQFADYAQQQQDVMRQELQRQRREVTHLMRVFEAMPDGIVVQDADGRVIMMNDPARQLLGSQRIFRSAGLHELAAVVGDELGRSLAPGLYTLGDPHRIHLDDRMLSAQAVAIMSTADYRIGTVVILRDLTDQVLLERQRDILLQELARNVQEPLAGMGQLGLLVGSDMVNAFAREVSRQAVALHKMIVDMREMALVDGVSVKRRQRALHLETLIWAVANEWRQVAQANKLTMHLLIERKGLFVLADEKRVRWAIGNIVDNAIKYTPSGGALTLEIKEDSDGMANIRIRDNGVGIAKGERPYVFTRFFRGRPVNSDGQEIRVPGMGQGLYIARQIFESHGGSIQIKTSQRVGTAVYMSLPLTAAVGLEMPHFTSNMEGETMQLPEEFLAELDQDYIERSQEFPDIDA